MEKLKFLGFLTLLAIISTLLGFGVFQIFFKPKLVGQTDQIEIPDVTKMSYQQAISTLEENGLEIETKREIYDSNIPKGYVVIQQPMPGMLGKAGSVVNVTLSKGTEDIIVPEMIGMADRQARILLARNSLSVRNIAYSYSEEYPKEYVIASTPKALANVKRGAHVDLLISLGRKKENGYIMPNLKGKNFSKVRNILEPLGIRVGKEEEIYDEFLVEGTILDQKPEAGLMISKNENILLTISTGGENNGY